MDPQTVKDWLSSTEEGGEVLREVTLNRIHDMLAEMNRPVQVLVVMHKDGWMEFYADPCVRVHVANMPPVSRGAEIEAERALEAYLPERVEKLYYPNAMRGVPMSGRPASPGKVASFLVADTDGVFRVEDADTDPWRKQ